MKHLDVISICSNYIKKLIKQEIKQTDEHIGEITARLQHNIEEKQKKVRFNISNISTYQI